MQTMQARLDGIAAEQAAAREPERDPNARADGLRVQVKPAPTTTTPAVDLAGLRLARRSREGRRPERAAAMLSTATTPPQLTAGAPTGSPGA
jgi:hypothetical protein